MYPFLRNAPNQRTSKLKRRKLLVNLKIKIDQTVRLFSLFQRDKLLNFLLRLRITSIEEDDVYIFQNYSENSKYMFILKNIFLNFD